MSVTLEGSSHFRMNCYGHVRKLKHLCCPVDFGDHNCYEAFCEYFNAANVFGKMGLNIVFYFLFFIFFKKKLNV